MVSQTLDGTVVNYLSYENVKIRLLGSYQIKNLRNVLTAIEILKSNGFKLENDKIIKGLGKAKWPARFEIINSDPVVIFDGGHNPEGVEAAVESTKKYFGEEKLYIITGVMSDKDYNYIAGKISEVGDKVFCLTPDNPRALNAEKYAEVFNSLGVCATAFESVESAVSAAIAEAKKDGKKILCLGSLYMYCEVVKYL